MPFKYFKTASILAALAIALGTTSTLSTTGSDQRASAVTTTQGLLNGTFEAGLAGWIGTPAKRARLATTKAGRTGQGLLAAKRSTGTLSVRTERPITLAGAHGDQYVARAWFRGSRVGQRAQLGLRELSGTEARQTVARTVAVRPGGWTRVTIRLTRLAGDTTFKVLVSMNQQRRTDQLRLDDVTLAPVRVTEQVDRGEARPGTDGTPTPTPTAPAPTASATTPAPAPTPPPGSTTDCFNARGVPSCGTLMGAAYGANTDPAAFESEIGHKLAVRRTYYTAAKVDSAVKTAKADLAAGRLPWISFKLPYSWQDMVAGKGDTWARDIAAKMAALPGPVWLAFHHEPEGDGDITAWRKMQERLAPLVRRAAPNVAYTVVLTGWNQLYGAAEYRLDAIWPRGVKIDVAGFDVYNQLGVVKDGKTGKATDLAGSYFKPFAAWAATHDVAWGLAETGYTDAASEVDPTWIQRTYAEMKTYGGVAFAYFNTTLNSIAPWDLSTAAKMLDFAKAQAVSLRLPTR